MSEPASGEDDAPRRFRAALAAVEAAPSAASFAELHEAALPLINHLRAAYTAAGRPYGDGRAGLYRWLEDVITQRDRGAAEVQSDPEVEAE